MPAKVIESTRVIASVCHTVAAGFDLCVRRTRDERIAVASRNAAAFLRALFEFTVAAAAEQGIDARPRARTGDRLRWEWLASTATVVDGNPDARLLSECARMLADAVATEPSGLGSQLFARLCAASAEAWSLALAVEHERRRELAVAPV